MSYVDSLNSYIRHEGETGKNPFTVRAAALEAASFFRSQDPRITSEVGEMEGAARDLEGCCRLYLDEKWDVALRSKPWWKRRSFARTKEAWQAACQDRLLMEASADIARLRSKAIG